ncbi:hypothetical protein [Cerasicoccus fimbriatus]|uniref:hypothetical protein n=1 Tax=Cerasicoccus fimbriatus TaxID=3014554 RepID=UPI0022B5B356|nr:hypothetical protein [Cerasicoccus sp. TK19100]
MNTLPIKTCLAELLNATNDTPRLRAGEARVGSVAETMPLLTAIVENLAERLAARNGGWVSANEVLAYVPVSLEMVTEVMDGMVDRQVVFHGGIDNCNVYEFFELIGRESDEPIGGRDIYSGEELDDAHAIFSPETRNRLETEIRERAEHDAWPAQAVWQHELLFVTAGAGGPVRLAEVAGHSRLTLGQVKTKLKELAKQKYCVLEEIDGQYSYRFPKMDYPRAAWRANDAAIRHYPSSRRDEFEVKMMKMLLSWIAIVGGVLAAAFVLRIHFFFLLLLGIAAAGIASWRILSARDIVEPKPIA